MTAIVLKWPHEKRDRTWRQRFRAHIALRDRGITPSIVIMPVVRIEEHPVTPGRRQRRRRSQK